MFSAADLPGTIPVFPLPGALLLPRARLPLHIFEPRYLAMFDDALKTRERLIGMIQPLGDDGEALNSIGCAGRITAFSETEDGRYMITLTGVSRFRLRREATGFTAYRRMDVGWDGFGRDLGAVEQDPGLERDRFFDLLGRFFTSVGLSADWDSLREAEAELLINSLAMLCPFDSKDKQALLESPSLVTRRETLVTLMEYSLRTGGSEEKMQ